MPVVNDRRYLWRSPGYGHGGYIMVMNMLIMVAVTSTDMGMVIFLWVSPGYGSSYGDYSHGYLWRYSQGQDQSRNHEFRHVAVRKIVVRPGLDL